MVVCSPPGLWPGSVGISRRASRLLRFNYRVAGGDGSPERFVPPRGSRSRPSLLLPPSARCKHAISTLQARYIVWHVFERGGKNDGGG